MQVEWWSSSRFSRFGQCAVRRQRYDTRFCHSPSKKNKHTTEIGGELVKWLFQSQVPLKAPPDNAQMKRNIQSTEQTAFSAKGEGNRQKEHPQRNTDCDVYSIIISVTNSYAVSKLSAIGIYWWIFCFFFSIFSHNFCIYFFTFFFFHFHSPFTMK